MIFPMIKADILFRELSNFQNLYANLRLNYIFKSTGMPNRLKWYRSSLRKEYKRLH